MLNAETGVPTIEETSYSTYSWRANECPQRLLWESARDRKKQRLFIRIARFWIHNNSPDLSIRFFSLRAKRSRSKATSNPNYTIYSRSNRAAHTEEKTRRLRGEMKGDEEGRKRDGGARRALNFAHPPRCASLSLSLVAAPLLPRAFFPHFSFVSAILSSSPSHPLSVHYRGGLFLPRRPISSFLPRNSTSSRCRGLFSSFYSSSSVRFSHVIFPTT